MPPAVAGQDKDAPATRPNPRFNIVRMVADDIGT